MCTLPDIITVDIHTHTHTCCIHSVSKQPIMEPADEDKMKTCAMDLIDFEDGV